MIITSKIYAFFVSLGLFALSIFTSAITITGGKVAFEQADKTAIDEAVGASVSGFWTSFLMVAPYIAIFAVLGFVVAVLFSMLALKRR